MIMMLSIYCNVNQDYSIKNGRVYMDKGIFDENVNEFHKKNKYNDEIIIFDINLFTKNDNTKHSKMFQAFFRRDFNDRENVWNRFISQKWFKVGQYIKKYLLQLTKNDPSILRNLVPMYDTFDNLVNFINRLIIFTFSYISIVDQPKYTTMFSINTEPIIKNIVQYKSVPNNKGHCSIHEFIGFIKTEEEAMNILDSILEKSIKYIFEVYIILWIETEQYDNMIRNIIRAYDPLYNRNKDTNNFIQIIPEMSVVD